MSSISQTETGFTKQVSAGIMGVSVRRLDQYVQKGMPRVGSGRKVRFGMAAFAWHREYLAEENGAGREIGKLQEEMARKTQIEADRAELKLLKEQGELVTIRSVRDQREKVYSIIKMRLLALPGKMAPIVFGMESKNKIKAKLEAEVYEALEELKSEGKR